MTEDATYERDLYEVEMDICYYAQLYGLHERLYARMDKAIKVIEIIAGSGAFYAVTVGKPGVTQLCALVVATAATISLVFDFSGRAREMRTAIRNYLDLVPALNRKGVTVQSMDEKLSKVGKDAPTIIDALRKPAYNQNVNSKGRYSCVLPLSWWEQVMKSVA